MCGIACYLALNRRFTASEVIVKMLENLEYRGYDSVGIAIIKDNHIEMRKDAGKLEEVRRKYNLEQIGGYIGIGHCLHPDSLVLLADGTAKKIKELPNEVEVLSYDFKNNRFVKAMGRVFKHYANELIKIKTWSSEIMVTPYHRIFVFDTRNEKVVEKFARDIKIGDLLILPQKINVTGNSKKLKEIDAKVYYKPTNKGWELIYEKLKENKGEVSDSIYYHLRKRDRNVSNKTLKALGIAPNKFFKPVNGYRTFVRFLEKTNPKLMRFLGYYFGDGSKDRRGIKFKDARREILEEYRKLAYEIFSIKGSIRKVDNHYVLRFNSVSLLNWLEENFPKIMKKKFPDWIGELTNEEIFAFLGGLYDAEGFISKNAKTLSIVMSDEGTLRSLQYLLLRAGILSSIIILKGDKTHKKKPVKLQISNKEYLERYLKHVGRYISRYKRREIIWLINKLRGHSYQHIKIPVPKNQLYEKFGVREVRGKGFLMLKTLEKYATRDMITYLMKYLRSPVVYQRVRSVEKVEYDGYVYDIEVEKYHNFVANCIIQHNSRWATHGGVNKINAHPHTDCKNEFAIVHNGIIENFLSLREELERNGHTFKGDTDTEVIVHLIEEYYREYKDVFKAFKKALSRLQGSFALAMVSVYEPDKVFFARVFSPLVIGVSDDGLYLASDVPAFLEWTNKVIFLEDWNVGYISRDGIYVEDLKTGEKIQKVVEVVPWTKEAAKKGGYPHFMLKEIFEQPETLKTTLSTPRSFIEKFVNLIEKSDTIYIIAAGTSYHASLYGELLFRRFGLNAQADISSEFEFRFGDVVTNRDLIIGISQSGETADTLSAIRYVKGKGAKIAAITNVVGSAITRLADYTVYMGAGPEIGVAATKTYTSQLATLAMIAYEYAKKHGYDVEEEEMYLYNRIPEVTKNVINETNELTKKIAEEIKSLNDSIYLGGLLELPTALEGALKLKEISYIHAEGRHYSAFEKELRNIITKDYLITLVVVDKNSLNMVRKIEKLDAKKMLIGNITSSFEADFVIRLDPNIPKYLTHIPYIVPLQLIAYYTSVKREYDPDKPRNLAKSVTVE